MEEICRVCVGTSGEFRNIFDERPTMDMCIGDMIAQCTGYVVKRGDSLPENICPPCLEDAISAFNLKSTCEQNHTLFFTLMDKDKKQDEDWLHSDDRTEQLKHQDDSNNSDNCKPKFTPREPHLSVLSGPYTCPHCSKSFSQSATLLNHICTHKNERPYQCAHCSKSFKQKSKLVVHSRVHMEERPYKCSYCPMSFKHLVNRACHRRSHKGDRRHQCSQCFKKFSKKSNLIRHMVTHTDNRTYQCTECPKTFVQNQHLKAHFRTHTGESPFKCTQCPEVFEKKLNLREHTRTHTGEQPYQCPQCLDAFISRAYLKIHIRTHTRTAELPFNCPYCTETFAQDGTQAQAHMRAHTEWSSLCHKTTFPVKISMS
ncbi:zinc finger protein 239-like isoform X1 [Drosophila miranda]|uniref:zinc finger protein 239-like isoform X1 n=1 Tax=Drosophila miranda TaxID=7229 RepID=UPI0007E5BD15|nr:zinc finger protein 239-like isoform X1 [Drosophila miranda]XP_033249171.1 zinc finger protein 239-like isoform X1 [Drosophila miranda]